MPRFAFIRLIPFWLLTLLLFANCNHVEPTVNIARSIDEDIVLVNIEDGDREFISRILLKIDSLKPLAVGINVFFRDRKSTYEDSALAHALHTMKNDILSYKLNDLNERNGSHKMFSQLVSGQGFLNYGDDFITRIAPLPEIDNQLHESFALKIIRTWQPDFKQGFKVNQHIPMNYQRTLEHFTRINGSELLDIPISKCDLPDKVFLVGYTGPGNEDKYHTPLHFQYDNLKPGEPDTYALVIIANQIRTILEYTD